MGTNGPGYRQLAYPVRPLRPSLCAISVDLDAAADQAISDGRRRRSQDDEGLIAADDFLGLSFEELRAAVSKGYSGGRLPQVRELKDAL